MPDSTWSAEALRRCSKEYPHYRMWLGAVLVYLALDCQAAYAQEPTPAQESDHAVGSATVGASITIEELARRMQLLERQNAELADRNRSLTHKLEDMTRRYDELNRRLERIEPGVGPSAPPGPSASPPGPNSPSRASGPPRSELEPELAPGPGTIPGAGTASNPGTPSGPTLPPAQAPSPWAVELASTSSRFMAGDYDDDLESFVLVRPKDSQRVPFEMRADIFTQARFFDFTKDRGSWIDSTGERQPIRSFDSVEVTRNFIVLSGYGLDPRLQYSAVIFSSTAINDTVYLGWINYHFNDALDLRVGNWLVPGTREWYTSFRYTLGADRLMATTFFRPNISPGIWLQGEPIRGLNYVAMFANSMNRFTQGIERVGSSGAFGGTVWWEPMGAFGPGPSDIENHRSLSTRLGTSLALSREANQGFGGGGPGNPQDPSSANPEDTILRLSDGTPLFRPGALGPGVELAAASVQLWALDAAFKYRGFSLSGEYFLRWIDGFQAAGRRPSFSSIFDNGGLLEGSYFVVPSRVEGFARTSFVTGPFGGGYEVGGGLNWFPQGKRTWRITFEVLSIDHSPAQNLLTGYRAGESGILYQLQWLTDF